MGLPGKRLSSSSKRRRASHFALKKKVLVACKKCQKEIVPHTVCLTCGTYKSREVVAMKMPKTKAKPVAHVHEEKKEPKKETKKETKK